MTERTKMTRSIVGVDEAGRGPLAGPVSVGVVVVPYDFNWARIPGVGDSKKIPEKKREALFLRAQELKKENQINFSVQLIDAEIIDTIGITQAVMHGVGMCFEKLDLDPKESEVRLDGLLKAPAVFKNQQTIIKGDATEQVIGLASILAKVTRDRHMVTLAKKYPKYQFEIHKGYGTKKHREIIQSNGLSPMHRRSFCKRFL